MTQPKTQYVYLIGSSGSSLVKIGTTNNVASRLKSIQNMSPAPLSVLWQVEGGFALERALHERFHQYRQHGEWFDFGQRNPVTVVSKAAASLAHLARDPKPLPQLRAADPEAVPRNGSMIFVSQWGRPVTVSREFLLDDRISGFARGIGAHLLALTGKFTLSQVATVNGCSQDAIRGAFDELSELDYLCIADGRLHFDGWPSPMERADQHMPGYSEYEPEELT